MFVESNFSFLRLNLGTNIYQDNLIGEELIKVRSVYPKLHLNLTNLHYMPRRVVPFLGVIIYCSWSILNGIIWIMVLTMCPGGIQGLVSSQPWIVKSKNPKAPVYCAQIPKARRAE
jgi:hypothetical protein